MRIEVAFFIYRRLSKKSIDLCEEIEIKRDYDADLKKEPTAVKVIFRPKEKRDLTKSEKTLINNFCNYHKICYEINDEGEIVWK